MLAMKCFVLTVQPNGGPACSMSSRMCQYYLHSTSRNKNFGLQNRAAHPSDLNTSERINRRNTATSSDLESARIESRSYNITYQ